MGSKECGDKGVVAYYVFGDGLCTFVEEEFDGLGEELYVLYKDGKLSDAGFGEVVKKCFDNEGEREAYEDGLNDGCGWSTFWSFNIDEEETNG